MHTVRVLHREEPGYGWSFRSPDLGDTALVGGGDTYDEARRMAEEAVRFHFETDRVAVEHFVLDSAHVAAAA